MLGPLFVKLGVKKAGEIGMNVREEDLIETYHVSDVMDSEVTTIPAGTSLDEVIQLVSRTEGFYYPVVDEDKHIIGAITLNGIRNTFATQEVNNWLVALDIMEPIIATLTRQTPLAEAFERAKRHSLEYLPVVQAEGDDHLVGLLDCPHAHRSLSAEVLSRQERADLAHDTNPT